MDFKEEVLEMVELRQKLEVWQRFKPVDWLPRLVEICVFNVAYFVLPFAEYDSGCIEYVFDVWLL
jgi:hypothetical protein